jgi:hypothetical protein
MQGEVRGIEANDISVWPNWSPTTPADEMQWFTVSIGMEGTEGSELFQVAVATYRGLSARRQNKKFVGLVVDDFNPARIEQAIQKHVAGVHANTWEDIAERLGPVMRWEYAE